jgi:hypothetical protein
VTRAGKMSHNEDILKIDFLLFSHSLSKYLQKDERFVGIGQKMTELRLFKVAQVTQVRFE